MAYWVILGPPGVGKSTFCKRYGVDAEDDGPWQTGIGRSAVLGWSDDEIREHSSKLAVPDVAIICNGDPKTIKRQNRKRHALKPGKRDYSPVTDRTIETTAVVVEFLEGLGVPMLKLNLTDG